LRRDRTATTKVTPSTRASVVRNAFPEQPEHDEIAMVLVNTGATEFDEFAANRLEGCENKLLLAVVAAMDSRRLARLQTIRADDLAGRDMLDEQVIADFIKWIGIKTGQE